MLRPQADSLLTGPVDRTLIGLALPMLAGIAAVITFNLVDTLYVGHLGARQLAAMSFTFPPVFIIMNIAMGLGVGSSSVIARALGEGDRVRARRLTTASLLLAVAVVVVFAGLGIVFMRPTFLLLGAPDDLLPLIEAYMVPWYLGVGLLVVPLVGNGALRAMGDTFIPSVIMAAAGLINVVVAPMLIFGWGPFPHLGLQGAALATVFSWAVVFPISLWSLARRERLIDFTGWSWAKLNACWRSVLHVGIPAAVTNVFVPVTGGIVTRLLAAHGESAVAAFGVGQRIESVAMIGVFALSTAVSPMVGQSHGAQKSARIEEVWRAAARLSLIWSALMTLLLAVCASSIAAWFSNDPEVIRLAAYFQRIVPVSFGFVGLSVVINTIFNSVGKPMHAALLIVVRLFGLTVPLAYLGARWHGAPGAFAGIALANVLTGLSAWLVARNLSRTGFAFP